MKDPADAVTLDIPFLGVVALPDWLRTASALCPLEAVAFGVRLDELEGLAPSASTHAFMVAYGRMVEARDRLYDAWLELELEFDAEDEDEAA